MFKCKESSGVDLYSSIKLREELCHSVGNLCKEMVTQAMTSYIPFSHIFLSVTNFVFMSCCLCFFVRMPWKLCHVSILTVL
jgi:hypothetical protein